MAQRAAKLRSQLKSARRVSDSAQASFLRSEDVHADLADREARRIEREASTRSEGAERFPHVEKRPQ